MCLDMFDWNDEELESIIWGEDGVSGDHIVPYPNRNDGKLLLTSGDQNKKECRHECTKLNPWQRSSDVKTGSRCGQSDASSIFGTNDRQSTSRFSLASLADLSSANSAKDYQDMATESYDINETMKMDSSRADTASLDIHNESLQNRPEDKVDGDFVDYGWANIGSFDDIDRFFSYDDSIFGHASLDNAYELWTSAKEVGNSLPLSEDSRKLTLGAPNNATEHIEMKAEYGPREYQPFMTGFSQWSDLKSHNQHNVHGFMDKGGHFGSKSKMILENQESLGTAGKAATSNPLVTSDNATTLNKLADKVNKKKKVLKYRKKLYEDGKVLQGPYGTWSQPGMQFQGSHTLPCRPSALPQKRQLHGPESSQYQHISSSQVACTSYDNPLSEDSDIPQSSSSHSEIFLGNTNHAESSMDPCMKPLTMTPQEKIEKLRKRQQLQALLAIQKQQQQINNIVSCSNTSIKETQNQITGGIDMKLEESLSSVPSLDTNSILEQDKYSTLCMTTHNNSLEGAILHQFQTVVSKLEIKERLCIRDSLFRLAQSSECRRYATDSNSPKKMREGHDFKEESKSQDSYPPKCDMETETNQTDRTVAHLLFHRQSGTPGKQNGTPESPMSTMGSLFSSSENMGNFLGAKYPCLLNEPHEGDQYITSPCIDSQTASNPDLVDGRGYGC